MAKGPALTTAKFSQEDTGISYILRRMTIINKMKGGGVDITKDLRIIGREKMKEEAKAQPEL